MVLIASFWSTDWICMVTIWLDSIERKSARSLSLISDASMDKKLMHPYISPIWKYLPIGNAKLLGAIKSLTESPDPVRYFQSKRNFASSPIWNCLCISSSLSLPFKLLACTPSLLKLLRISVSICVSLGFAVFMDSAWIPKVRYLVFVRPLFPASIWWRSTSEYSSLTSSNPSFLWEILMLFSKSDTSVAIFSNESWNFTELSKKFKNAHHSSKISVLSSCCASW